jgi:DNA polymerase
MLTARQQHCLRGIDITQWQIRSDGDLAPSEAPALETIATILEKDQFPATTAPTVTASPTSKHSESQNADSNQPQQDLDVSDWEPLIESIESCQNCALAQSCSRKVPGKGNQLAELMIIGEAPGHEEDLQGLPFVGRAGQLLNKMLQAIDVDPDKVYITNILKCRPPNNRDPKVEEVEACAQFLQAQVRLIKPKVIFSVGRISAQNLLKDSSPVGQLRTRQHTLPHSNIPLLVTYHPAYLLRNPAEKAKVWQDLKTLRQLLQNETD